MKMRIIGVTGGTGAGKSALCQELERLGAKIIDLDKISRQVSKINGEAYAEIVESFGKEILNQNNEINRKVLAEIVFNDKEKLELLNSITHKHIFAKMNEEIARARAELVVLDVPLLFKTDFPIKCDLTVAVIAPQEMRISRIMARDGIDRESALARIKNQMGDDEYKALADVCYENDGDIASLQKFAESLSKSE